MNIKQYILGKNYSILDSYFGKFSESIGSLLFLNLKGNKSSLTYDANIIILFQNRAVIVEVLKISQLDQILVFSERGKLEVLDMQLIYTLASHNKKVIEILKKNKNNILLDFPLIALYEKDTLNNLKIQIYISLKQGDTTVFGAYNICFYIGDIKIFIASIYISIDSIFLANMQYMKGAKEFLDLVKYHRIVFFIIQYFSSILDLNRVISYSNFLHPSKLGKEHNGFKGNYDSLAKSMCMSLNKDGFFDGDITSTDIKIPYFHKSTIMHNLDKIQSLF